MTMGKFAKMMFHFAHDIHVTACFYGYTPVVLQSQLSPTYVNSNFKTVVRWT